MPAWTTPRADNSQDDDASIVIQGTFAAGVTQRLKRRQKIRFERTSGPYLYYVQQGLLATEIELPGERRSLVDIHFTGDIVSSECVPGAATAAIALTPATVRRLPVGAAEKSFAANEKTTRAILHLLERQAQQSRLRCAVLTRLTGEERVATFLIQLAQRNGRRLGDRISVALPIGREDIGDYLGLNADTVSRIFTRLRKAQIVELSGRADLRILDWQGICNLTPIKDALIAQHEPAPASA